jgi:hypothetical protein
MPISVHCERSVASHEGLDHADVHSRPQQQRTIGVAQSVVNSGDIGSGKIASGAVQGFFGATRHVTSGMVGVFDLGSGAVLAASVESRTIRFDCSLQFSDPH